MARRKSISSTSKPTAKKQKTSSASSVFEKNPFWKIYGQDSDPVSIDVDGNGDAMVVDEENGGSDNLVDHALDDMLRFMELSKKRNLGHDSITVDDGDAKDREEQNQKLFGQQSVRQVI